MKILDTSNATTSVGQPVKSGTLNFLQLAYQEGLSAAISLLVGNGYATNTIYVLSGCINTGSGSTLAISAGWLFVDIGDGGKIYYFAGAGFTPSGVGISNFATAQYTTNADPVTLTNGTSVNVHNMVTIVVVDGTSGTGNVTGTAASNFSNWVRLGSPNAQALLTSSFPTTLTLQFQKNQFRYFTTGLISSNSYTITWDFTGAIPGTTVRLKFTSTSGCTLTVASPAGSAIINDSGTFNATKTNVIYAIYCGVNDAGNNEVSYTINNF